MKVATEMTQLSILDTRGIMAQPGSRGSPRCFYANYRGRARELHVEAAARAGISSHYGHAELYTKNLLRLMQKKAHNRIDQNSSPCKDLYSMAQEKRHVCLQHARFLKNVQKDLSIGVQT
ncbi:unnamed protein product [Leptidea sinapis]|uniref:Uncharacterized protein n=1 Tax=Leptidea sinapis TaxID=189913 RepID=A0A5E4QFH8_9NEOP|nr:unnamed protein product [Leptidea sinapis]